MNMNTMKHLATCKKSFVPTEEQQEVLTQAFKLARRNRYAVGHSFYWKVGLDVFLFLKRDDAVVVKRVPRNAIAKWQRVQLLRKDSKES